MVVKIDIDAPGIALCVLSVTIPSLPLLPTPLMGMILKHLKQVSMKSPFLSSMDSQVQPLRAFHHVHRLAGTTGSGSPANLAASLVLSKEVPTVSRYGTHLSLSTSSFTLRSNHSLFDNSTAALPANLNPDGTWKDDVPENGSNLLIEQLTPIEKKWEEAWDHPDRVQDSKPSRVPLRSKRTKKCPARQHILIKPERKAQAIRCKIKLIASNCLPLIKPQHKRIARSTGLGTERLASGISAAAGRTYTAAGSHPLILPSPESGWPGPRQGYSIGPNAPVRDDVCQSTLQAHQCTSLHLTTGPGPINCWMRARPSPVQCATP
ncbi:hypothetical protein MJO28_011823 [Puccinia striiformis f. sp. tritici]|uniref:Dynactin subunit 4 n=2 Tax=Puccinia striiformis TaxID=27350 RepID=A0A2S4V1U4_9BASI|nr:hypothetical protein MJO28_011823 [Puccinia striiformis f. sp. tritici]POW03405.1 hypothetical protein PSTT_11102 [Puccinia striiformis]